METTVKERLIQFIKYKGMNKHSFEKACGLSTGFISNMRVSLQPNKVMSIANIFPDLNTGWLLTGEGTMLKLNTQPSTIGNGNITGNIANNSNIISTNANGNFNNVQTSIGGDSKKVEKETNKLKLEIGKLKAEIERLNEKNGHLMESMQLKDELIISLRETIELLKGK